MTIRLFCGIRNSWQKRKRGSEETEKRGYRAFNRIVNAFAAKSWVFRMPSSAISDSPITSPGLCQRTIYPDTASHGIATRHPQYRPFGLQKYLVLFLTGFYHGLQFPLEQGFFLEHLQYTHDPFHKFSL